MAIELYTGFVGSGKSYHATSKGIRIADAPKGKRWVVANFPIKPKKKFLAKIPFVKKYIKQPFNEPRWIFKPNEELTVDFLVNLSMEKGWYGKESQALLIFDEAGIPFNAREWNSKPKERLKWIEWLSQSRKFGYDVIFVVQDMRMMDRQIRSLAEYEVIHKKLNNWGIGWMIPFTIFAGVKYWNGIRQNSGSVEFSIYTKAVANRYDTLRLFGEMGNAPEGSEVEGVPKAGYPTPSELSGAGEIH